MIQKLKASKKLILILSVSIMLGAVLLFVYIERQKNPLSLPSTVTPTTTVPPEKISPLQRSVPGQPVDQTIESLPEFRFKEFGEGNRVSFVLESPIPERANTIVTEDDTVTYERVTTPEDPQVEGFVTISEFENKYGMAEEIISGSLFYGEHMSTYVYPSRGVAFIANPFNDEVYEIQVFTPMSFDQYKKEFGEDIPTGPFDQEVLKGEDSSLDLETEIKGIFDINYTGGEKRIFDHPGEFYFDFLCLLSGIFCGLSDIDNVGSESPPPLPTPRPPDPPPGTEITPTPGAGLTYDIPIKNSSIEPTADSRHTGWRDRLENSFSNAKFEYYENYILPFAKKEGLNPAFLLTLWTEETGASTTTLTRVGGAGLGRSKEHLGCAPQREQTIQENLECLKGFMTRWNIQGFADFAKNYCGPNIEPICANNENFLNNIAYWYDQYVPPGTPGARTPLQ